MATALDTRGGPKNARWVNGHEGFNRVNRGGGGAVVRWVAFAYDEPAPIQMERPAISREITPNGSPR